VARDPDCDRVIIELGGLELSGTVAEATYPADARWLPAVVPGGVHESLLAAGVIEHPYFGNGEQLCRWVEETTWWYRCRFARPFKPGSRTMLRFACLDSVADIWLNGSLLGHVRNQHRPHEFDVTALLSDDNLLVLRFPRQLHGLLTVAEEEDAVAAARQRQRAVRPSADELDRSELILPAMRSRVRKATFSWGWDFAARVPSLGVLAPITLAEQHSSRLGSVSVRTTELDVQARTAAIAVSAVVDGSEGLSVVVSVRSPSGHVTSVRSVAMSEVGVRLSLSDVEPWWTHDLGGQPMYEVAVQLLRGDDVVDSAQLRVGIRTIELDRAVDKVEDARYFRFRLNGVPVFARGANWVPPSLLIGSVSDATYESLVALARQANMTMLRVWGGGIYEPDLFYDTCDEAGLLVWQDFMFACFDYPAAGTDLVEEVRREAVHQVARLRHHPCLALWCGNNEVQGIHELTVGNLAPGDWGDVLFSEVLPSIVADLDPATPYWPGSPWGERADEIVNGVRDGDRHAWEVWHGIDVGAGGPTTFESRGDAVHFHRYDRDRGRFISEFGIHATPELGTLERWTPPGSLGLGTDALEQRQKDTPKDKGWALMERETGAPTNLTEYVDFSMACQAEGLKHGVEHYRRRQPHCSGTLVWQFNDSWPGLSWSVVDYDLVPKAAYYFLRRAYEPVLLSFRTSDGGLELWVTSSASRDHQLVLTIEVRGFDGSVDHCETVVVTAKAYTSEPVWSAATVPPADRYAWVSAVSETTSMSSNRRFFAPLKALPFADNPIAAAVDRRGNSAVIELRASGYAYLTRVTSSLPGARFSSNYVDLRPSDMHTIEVSGLAAAAQLHVATYRAPAVVL
jgi:beta-mannosidase